MLDRAAFPFSGQEDLAGDKTFQMRMPTLTGSAVAWVAAAATALQVGMTNVNDSIKALRIREVAGIFGNMKAMGILGGNMERCAAADKLIISLAPGRAGVADNRYCCMERIML